MKALLIASIFVMFLIPLTSAFSQSTDSEIGISVIATNDAPYVYTNTDGKTTVIGEIQNNNALTAISGVIVKVTFYDESGEQVIEIVRGSTIIDVMAPESKSPYVVTSTTDDPNIALVSVEVENFNSSPPKSVGLEIESTNVSHNETLNFSGTISNMGNVVSSDTIAYLAFYDIFEPARILHVESVSVGTIPIDGTADFEFSGLPNPKAVGFKIFAESDILQSTAIDVTIPPQEIMTRMISISNLSIMDSAGKNISNIPVDSTVGIDADLSFQTSANDRIQPYVYYVQIKQSGEKAYVEFIGSLDGNFHGTPSKTVSIPWTPENPGLYFIETFVWDQNSIPISSKGPASIILVS